MAETSSTLRRWSSARRDVWTHVAFGRSLYSVRDCGTLCLDCYVTLVKTLLDILQVNTAHRGFGDLCAIQIQATLTYLLKHPQSSRTL